MTDNCTLYIALFCAAAGVMGSMVCMAFAFALFFGWLYLYLPDGILKCVAMVLVFMFTLGAAALVWEGEE